MQSLEILTVQFSEDGVFNTTFSFFQYFCQPFLQTRLSLLALKKQEVRGGRGGLGNGDGPGVKAPGNFFVSG